MTLGGAVRLLREIEDGMTQPLHFAAAEWIDLGARGVIAVIAALPDGLYDPTQLIGRCVVIDGKEWRVRAAEAHAVPRGPHRPYKGAFGLLVERAESDDG